jgi:hypothetical protein
MTKRAKPVTVAELEEALLESVGACLRRGAKRAAIQRLQSLHLL